MLFDYEKNPKWKSVTNDPVYKKALQEYYSYEYSPLSWWMSNYIVPWGIALCFVLGIVGVIYTP